MPIKEDLTKQTFGRLTVQEEHSVRSKDGRPQWVCECSCGSGKRVIAVGKALKNGGKASCGCLRRESLEKVRAEHLTKHGGKGTRLYSIYRDMLTRCYNLNRDNYYLYGGRGVTVCDEWKEGFIQFRDWAMSNGYSDSLTIDRLNVDGNYEPDNCRWATMAQQANNKRSNHYITYCDETHTIMEWSNITGINNDMILNRINSGWTIKQALFLKPHGVDVYKDHNGFDILMPKIQTKSGKRSSYGLR